MFLSRVMTSRVIYYPQVYFVGYLRRIECKLQKIRIGNRLAVLIEEYEPHCPIEALA